MSAPARTAADVPVLVESFERCTLSRAEWTHRAHLEVALWYASSLPAAEALEAMRAGIQRLNAAHGTVTTPTGGYHETITRAYMRLVRHFALEDRGAGGWSARVERLMAPHGGKDHLLRHYSRDRLMSLDARFGWVEPDLLPLP